MQPATPQQIYLALKELLGPPEMCASFELRVRQGDLVTVACEHYLSDNKGGIAQLGRVLSEFELVPRAGATHLQKDEAINFDAWMRQRTDAAHDAYMARTSRMLDSDRRKILADAIYKNVIRPYVHEVVKML